MASHISAHSIQPIKKKKNTTNPKDPYKINKLMKRYWFDVCDPNSNTLDKKKSLVTYMTSRLVGTCILEIAYQLNHF